MNETLAFAIYGAAAVAMIASHAILSAPGWRETLVRRLGRGPFFAAYGAVSTAALVALIAAFLEAPAGPHLYAPIPGARALAVGLMPLAVLLVVGRLTTRPGDHGIYRLCRQPGSAGLLLWAGLHLLNMGDARRTLLFATMAAIALVALVRHARAEAASPGEAVLGAIPLAAVVAGREHLAWREIGLGRLALALAVYAALLALHPLVIGVDPLAF